MSCAGHETARERLKQAAKSKTMGWAERSAERHTADSCGRSGKQDEVFPDFDAIRRRVRNVVQIDPFRWPDSGAIHALEVRIEPGQGGRKKDIRQVRPVEGGFTWGGPKPPHPLCNAQRAAEASEVVVVEGPKAVRALQRLGITAVSSFRGAHADPGDTDWSALSGSNKRVILWPDNDPEKNGERTGLKFMRGVGRELEKLSDPPRVLWLDPDLLELPQKGDATDFIQKHSDLSHAQQAQAVRDALTEAYSLGPSSEVSAIIGDAIEGRRFVVPWPWPTLGSLSRALTPATVTLLVASPGATKSLALIEAAQHWNQQDHKPAILGLEDGRAFHLRRALAQRAGVADLTDDDWCRQNPEAARAATDEHEAFADSFGRCIHELRDDAQPTFEAVGDWIEQQALAGRRVIAVDPLSIAEQQHEQYRQDQQFTARVKRIAEQNGCSIVLVMHPRKGAQTKTVDDVAGGAAYGRLAQTVLWIESWPEPRTVTVRDRLTGWNIEHGANRAITLAKARNGRGMGTRIAYQFDSATLRLHERGVMTKRGGDD
jgi:KaiC/GvpD/RAD55 family RecA-like ATPase